MESSKRFYINNQSSINTTLLNIQKSLESSNYQTVQISKITTVASELAYNIIKYAQNGRLYFEFIEKAGNEGVEITSEDFGPGIEDTKKALLDNYSSSGTLGLGLPGVKRMSDIFTLDSSPGKGTKVTSIIWKNK